MFEFHLQHLHILPGVSSKKQHFASQLVLASAAQPRGASVTYPGTGSAFGCCCPFWPFGSQQPAACCGSWLPCCTFSGFWPLQLQQARHWLLELLARIWPLLLHLANLLVFFELPCVLRASLWQPCVLQPASGGLPGGPASGSPVFCSQLLVAGLEARSPPSKAKMPAGGKSTKKVQRAQAQFEVLQHQKCLEQIRKKLEGDHDSVAKIHGMLAQMP